MNIEWKNEKKGYDAGHSSQNGQNQSRRDLILVEKSNMWTLRLRMYGVRFA